MSIVEDIKTTFKGNNNGVGQLIIINIIAFILTNLISFFFFISPSISGNDKISIYQLLGCSPQPEVFLHHCWSIATYMFVHKDVFQLLFNMLWFYWAGQLFVSYIGSKQLIGTYVLGGITGAILFTIYSVLWPNASTNFPLIGASASVMAVVVAIAFLIPNFTVQLVLIGQVKLKYIALGAFLISSLIDLSSNTGGKIAHIGGALYGFAFTYYYKKGIDIGKFITYFFNWIQSLFSKTQPLKVEHRRPLSDEEYNANKVSTEKKTNEILDKIARSGYDSLNKEEKEFLFKQSQR